MNYDELLCYLINQVEYFNYWKTIKKRIGKSIKELKRMLEIYVIIVSLKNCVRVVQYILTLLEG